MCSIGHSLKTTANSFELRLKNRQEKILRKYVITPSERHKRYIYP